MQPGAAISFRSASIILLCGAFYVESVVSLCSVVRDRSKVRQHGSLKASA